LRTERQEADAQQEEVVEPKERPVGALNGVEDVPVPDPVDARDEEADEVAEEPWPELDDLADQPDTARRIVELRRFQLEDEERDHMANTLSEKLLSRSVPDTMTWLAVRSIMGHLGARPKAKSRTAPSPPRARSRRFVVTDHGAARRRTGVVWATQRRPSSVPIKGRGAPSRTPPFGAVGS
jgi:hypothetical protein